MLVNIETNTKQRITLKLNMQYRQNDPVVVQWNGIRLKTIRSGEERCPDNRRRV